MNITYLIGNGFDVGIGLKTQYSDFYKYFIDYAQKDNIIVEWIKSDNDIELWKDLERALGQKTIE